VVFADNVNLCSPNDTDGVEIVDVIVKGSISIRLDANTKTILDDELTHRERTLLIQIGSAPGYPGVQAFWAYAVTFAPTPIGGDGMLTKDLQFQVIRSEAGIALGLPQWAILRA
jgi:hypothetical protein